MIFLHVCVRLVNHRWVYAWEYSKVSLSLSLGQRFFLLKVKYVEDESAVIFFFLLRSFTCGGVQCKHLGRTTSEWRKYRSVRRFSLSKIERLFSGRMNKISSRRFAYEELCERGSRVPPQTSNLAYSVSVYVCEGMRERNKEDDSKRLCSQKGQWIWVSSSPNYVKSSVEHTPWGMDEMWSFVNRDLRSPRSSPSLESSELTPLSACFTEPRCVSIRNLEHAERSSTSRSLRRILTRSVGYQGAISQRISLTHYPRVVRCRSDMKRVRVVWTFANLPTDILLRNERKK